MADKVETPKAKAEQGLALLREAMKDEGEHVKSLMSDKYQDVKEGLMDAKDKMGEYKKKVADATTHYKDVATAKTKEVATAVDDNVHKNPWPYIGGAAVGGLLLGFILGKKS